MIPGFGEFMVHEVTVETKSGEDSWGNVHTVTSAPIPGFLDDSRALVRSAAGDQVVSESTFYTGKEHAPLFAPESLVNLPDRVSTVIRCKTADSGPLDLPDHIAVTLT
ncbi:hypothetical protein QFZ79_002894 [Arthrobacter sp. V4I6]|uniref:hypothetical protein n=1 Tax=Arthrobacter sp. V4I6 TaxID=3042281 RepID=UPI00277FCAB0|nr:hypothetical protein [Arthrobacter sp. V4I6]MDQ0854783.1 hypothetical protein [Arthrobacter sp. V4I6]